LQRCGHRDDGAGRLLSRLEPRHWALRRVSLPDAIFQNGHNVPALSASLSIRVSYKLSSAWTLSTLWPVSDAYGAGRSLSSSITCVNRSAHAGTSH
jgi:hypothetical protein